MRLVNCHCESVAAKVAAQAATLLHDSVPCQVTDVSNVLHDAVVMPGTAAPALLQSLMLSIMATHALGLQI